MVVPRKYSAIIADIRDKGIAVQLINAVCLHSPAGSRRAPQPQRKTEPKVTLSGHPVDSRRRDTSLEELQAETDGRVERWAKRALYPVTELWGHQSWGRALERLAPLPILPAPFDVAVTRTVPCDALVQLGLEHVTAQLDDSVSDAVKANAAPHVFFEKLLSGGLQQREQRRFKKADVG